MVTESGAGNPGLGARRWRVGHRANVRSRPQVGLLMGPARRVYRAGDPPGGALLDAYRAWIAQRAREVDFNETVLHRELRNQGFPGSVIIVRRAISPLRATATATATVRFETGLGEQAQVDFGQVRVWIAGVQVAAQIFVMTLGFSRRLLAVAFARQRLREWLGGHELAFQASRTA